MDLSGQHDGDIHGGDLHDHGDRQAPPGTLDLAVNVLRPTPAWLVEELGRVDLAEYPSAEGARTAVAARHGVTADSVLPVNGAAEAFWSLAHGLRPRLAACVHPSFTAPEAALRSAGTPVHRVVRSAEDGFALDLADVPEDADLVVLGGPDNPTGRRETLDVVEALVRPGRVLVLDEAFADFLPDGRGLAAAVGDVPGLVVVRSLTKLWGLAGLRVGYLLAAPALVVRLATALQPWPVSAPALRALELLSPAETERRQRSEAVARSRETMVAALTDLSARRPAATLRWWASEANFLLARTAVVDLRSRLLAQGVAVRRGETFPGLDTSFVRIAVPASPADLQTLATALDRALVV